MKINNLFKLSIVYYMISSSNNSRPNLQPLIVWNDSLSLAFVESKLRAYVLYVHSHTVKLWLIKEVILLAVEFGNLLENISFKNVLFTSFSRIELRMLKGL